MNSVIGEIIPESAYELVRDQVVAIIVAEFSRQRTLATGALRDWYDSFFDADGLKIFVERGTPFDSSELNAINVYFGSENMGSGTVLAVDGSVKIAVDVVGASCGSRAMRGDERSARIVQRVAGVIRRILMHPQYVVLGMVGTVHGRKVSAISMGEPSALKDAEFTIGCGLALDVSVTEKLGTSVSGVLCESTNLTIDRDTGRIIIKGNSL